MDCNDWQCLFPAEIPYIYVFFDLKIGLKHWNPQEIKKYGEFGSNLDSRLWAHNLMDIWHEKNKLFITIPRTLGPSEKAS